MARFELQLPEGLMKDFQKLYNDADKIFGAMTEAGADVVMANVRNNVPASFRGSNIMSCLRKTRVYRTPTDDGINTKVGFHGYFVNRDGKREPAPLVVNVFEYGSSKFPKKPFFRKSFRKDQIEKAMLETQKKLSGGLLDE